MTGSIQIFPRMQVSGFIFDWIAGQAGNDGRGALRALGLAPGARRRLQNACSDNPASQGLPDHAN